MTATLRNLAELAKCAAISVLIMSVVVVCPIAFVWSKTGTACAGKQGDD
jgi:hypothetical protein